MTTANVTSKPTRVTISSKGIPGAHGWSPIFGIVEDGDRRVFQIEDWVGGTGFKPPVGQYVGPDGLVDDIAEAVDVRGGIGDTGDLGWSPELAVVPDGERRVLQVADWAGGTGTAPDTGQYVGPDGLVDDIAEATDIRGSVGPVGDFGWSPVLAVITDGDRRVLQVADWSGGTGTMPPVGQYLGEDGLVSDISGAVDIRGEKGDRGFRGWSPVLAVIGDGERRVHQVTDWTGSTGDKPPVGQYIGTTGLVSDIAEATDIRGGVGERGPMGVAAGYEFGVFVMRDDGVVDGEYPATLSVWTEMVLNRFYAEAVGGDAAVSVIVNGDIVHGPLTVNEGSPVTDTILLELEEGDQVSIGIVAYGSTRVWAQVDGVEP